MGEKKRAKVSAKAMVRKVSKVLKQVNQMYPAASEQK